MKKNFLLLTFVFFYSIASYAQLVATDLQYIQASSEQTDQYPIRYAFDQDWKTRWSSAFQDNVWLEMTLKQKTVLGGMVLHWEAAFAKTYEIQVSSDQKNWQKVFATDSGDGGIDYVFFPLQEIQYVKVHCQKRATAWGFSLFEIEFLTKDQIPNVAISKVQFSDQNYLTQIQENEKSYLEFSFPYLLELSGLELTWNKSNDIDLYEVWFENSGSVWEKLDIFCFKNKAKDLVLFRKLSLKKLRVVFDHEPEREVQSVILKHENEEIDLLRIYRLLAQYEELGIFPKWLKNEQLYWTITGNPDSEEELLVGEDGSLELFQKGPLMIPYFKLGSQLITAQKVEIKQSLLDHYLPIPQVQWTHPLFTLDQIVYMTKTDDLEYGVCRYTLHNTGNQKLSGQFLISLWPVQMNPAWQYGGLSQISSVEVQNKEDISILDINHNLWIANPTGMFKKGVSTNDPRKIQDFFVKHFDNDFLIVEDQEKQNIFSLFKLDVNLEPNDTQTIDFIIFKDPRLLQIDLKKEIVKKERIQKEWHQRLDKVLIYGLEPMCIQLLKSNLAYILINKDRAAFQPGSRNYSRSWIRDGAMTGAALLRFGFEKEVREYIEWFSEQIGSDGWVPFIIEKDGSIPGWCADWKEYDSFGEYVYLIMEYYRFTKDLDLLKKCFPKIVQVLKYQTQLRHITMQENYLSSDPAHERYQGILPASHSHEGYFPERHSYWDDYWGLKGLEDGIEASQLCNSMENQSWMKKEYQEFQTALRRSIEMTMQVKKVSYVPGCADLGDEDASSVSIGIYPTEQSQYFPKEWYLHTFQLYYQKTVLPRLQNGLKNSYTPYEIRNIHSFIELGMKSEAWKALKYFMNDCRPLNWNHLAEVVHPELRQPQYIGDMPHTWVGTELILCIRNILLEEKEGQIFLTRGIDWSVVKIGEQITVHDMPTYFGKVSFEIKKLSDHQFDTKIWGDAKPPKGFVVVLDQKSMPVETDLPYQNIFDQL